MLNKSSLGECSGICFNISFDNSFVNFLTLIIDLHLFRIREYYFFLICNNKFPQLFKRRRCNSYIATLSFKKVY